jgi:hypothetical protein
MLSVNPSAILLRLLQMLLHYMSALALHRMNQQQDFQQ